MQCGGIVVCGGESRRMGYSKALLPFGPEVMLQRVLGLLGEVLHPLVVVAALDQQLPQLPPGVQVAHDRRQSRGPLEGIAVGLSALPAEVEAAYVTSCDVPLLRREFVSRMIELLTDHDIAVPHTEGFHHPLAAVYRRSVLPQVESLLEQDRLRPVFLFEQLRTRVVGEEELREVDPNLDTLKNLNRPEEYLAALKDAGFKADPEVLKTLGDKPDD